MGRSLSSRVVLRIKHGVAMMGMGVCREDLAIEEIRNLWVGPDLPRPSCSCDAEGDGGLRWDWAIMVGVGHDGELQEVARGLRWQRR